MLYEPRFVNAAQYFCRVQDKHMKQTAADTQDITNSMRMRWCINRRHLDELIEEVILHCTNLRLIALRILALLRSPDSYIVGSSKSGGGREMLLLTSAWGFNLGGL